ncbi:cellulose synthase operon protein YhjQ/BcsQ [Tuwongella immobilis]|uniref:AAA domain-containing protein n=1 Tax=Tuwongella immobilis TaxID=692036 RepID=A0A6C2YK65_9BACT|nr:cellulose synthase operon protein YhjQ/BcsQ [Tuwongella immobilis]VIP01619.1 Capsular exopolysaccharide family protein OS=Bacillus cereus B5-2 GN=KQ3_02991 PE=4 SV=1: AAA_31 [Tuwongella immobilis]VTR98946.1 Capsular exopolysaccharide family protein OS=Bacillus cereus B5-2 GN=KQ3_02991 PE=4 SV=1: AAA_31 [Tuwongella immobilis]
MGRIFDSLNRSRELPSVGSAPVTGRSREPRTAILHGIAKGEPPLTPATPPPSREATPSTLPTPKREEDDVPYIEIGSASTGGTIFHLPPSMMPISKPVAPIAPIPAAAPAAAPISSPVAMNAKHGLPTLLPTLPAMAIKSRGEPTERPTLPMRKLFTIRFRALPEHLRRQPTREIGISPQVVTYHEPDHAISREYVALSREIEQQLGMHSPRTVVFASPMRGCGTSSVLMNLAVALARSPQRVLAIEGHTQNPALAAALGCATEPGLADLIGQSLPFNWSLHPTLQPHLHLLPTGRFTTSTPADAFATIHEPLGRRYDWLLVDSPLDAVLDWAPRSDAIYLVVPDDALESPLVTPWHNRLVAAGKLRGYILTQPVAN